MKKHSFFISMGIALFALPLFSCSNIVSVNHSLIYQAESGGTISGQTIQAVLHGKNGTSVTALPAAKYIFVSWSDGSTSPSRFEVNVVENLIFTATFSLEA